ncbi:hypothetical protein ABKN59_010087 [Abortiporus biennis]
MFPTTPASTAASFPHMEEEGGLRPPLGSRFGFFKQNQTVLQPSLFSAKSMQLQYFPDIAVCP